MLFLRSLSAIAVAVVVVQPAFAQYKIGDRLVVISQAEITSGGVVRQVLGRGQDVRVDGVNGDQLLVKNLAPGWIRQDLVRRPEIAVDVFSNQIAFNPLDAGAFYARGIIRADLNQYDQAIIDFSQAIWLGPHHACGYIGRGNCYANTNEPARALEDYTAAIRLDPNSAIAFANRARALNTMGDYASAMADANEAIRLAPAYASAFSARAVAYAATQRFAEALADCDRIAAISAPGVSGFNDVAWFLAMSPDPAIRDGVKAVEFASKAHSLSNGLDGGVLDTLAVAWAELGDFNKAVSWENKAIAVSSERDRPNFESHLRVFESSRTLFDDQIASDKGPVPLSSRKSGTKRPLATAPQHQQVSAKVGRYPVRENTD